MTPDRSSPAAPPIHDAKRFHRRLERLLDGLDGGAATERYAGEVVPLVLRELGADLGVTGAHLYQRDADRARLLESWGESAKDLSPELPRRLSASDASAIADLPWVGETTAGVAGLLGLDEGGSLLVALFLTRDPEAAPLDPSRFAHALSTLDYALRQQRHRRELEDLVAQARAIQLSLLPAGRPAFGDFDIAAASVPAREVGGDLYDFLPLDRETLGLAVADASGHGLPAALQARDVAMGLRMGAERDLKITRLVEKLNRIIHKSGLVTRFVSLVYGELELNGNFGYINAGHPPPLLLDDSGFHELTVGGLILGPAPDSLYKLGFAHVDRGAVLALYSDGVIERGTESGRPFGVERLQAWMRKWRDGLANQAVDDLLQRLKDHDRAEPLEDDVTIVFVRRPR